VADRRPRLSFRQLLWPILIFAPINALGCWAMMWLFRDNNAYATVFLGFGCAGIVVALCAYLTVFVANIERN
jgi:hypothetical protein